MEFWAHTPNERGEPHLWLDHSVGAAEVVSRLLVLSPMAHLPSVSQREVASTRSTPRSFSKCLLHTLLVSILSRQGRRCICMPIWQGIQALDQVLRGNRRILWAQHTSHRCGMLCHAQLFDRSRRFTRRCDGERMHRLGGSSNVFSKKTSSRYLSGPSQGIRRRDT